MLIEDYMQGKEIKLNEEDVEMLLNKVLGDEYATLEELFEPYDGPARKEVVDWGSDVGCEIVEC